MPFGVRNAQMFFFLLWGHSKWLRCSKWSKPNLWFSLLTIARFGFESQTFEKNLRFPNVVAPSSVGCRKLQKKRISVNASTQKSVKECTEHLHPGVATSTRFVSIALLLYEVSPQKRREICNGVSKMLSEICPDIPSSFFSAFLAGRKVVPQISPDVLVILFSSYSPFPPTHRPPPPTPSPGVDFESFFGRFRVNFESILSRDSKLTRKRPASDSKTTEKRLEIDSWWVGGNGL